jgi:hypothetical protein
LVDGVGFGEPFGKGWSCSSAIIGPDDGFCGLIQLIYRHAGATILWSGGARLSSFAILRKFCAVAASRNSSCAPLSPRKRKRSSFSIRFRCANSIIIAIRRSIKGITIAVCIKHYQLCNHAQCRMMEHMAVQYPADMKLLRIAEVIPLKSRQIEMAQLLP